jgi:exodeoxyribonuclease VII small subunit
MTTDRTDRADPTEREKAEGLMAERKQRRFDEGIAELEKILAQLERGDLALEDALAAYESGVALVRELNQRLEAAEARVQSLARAPGGDLRLRPMEPEEDGES